MTVPLLAARPFSTLGLVPFLYAAPADMNEIQREYFKLSRKFHPDLLMNVSHENRSMQEASSARLNSDYAVLKDFWRLLESVVHGAKIPQVSKGSLPPALAAEYFELQDLWEAKGPQAPESIASQKELLTKVHHAQQAQETQILTFARRFPFQGFGNAAAPWQNADLAELGAALQKLRYLRAFSHDLENKMTEKGAS